MSNKRPLEVDTAVNTPSKKATIRRAVASNKRSSDELAPETNTTTKKKTRQPSELTTEESPDNAFSPAEKPAKKASARRNTERLSSLLEAKNILPSPSAAKKVFTEENTVSDEENERVEPVSGKKQPRVRKSLQPKTSNVTTNANAEEKETKRKSKVVVTTNSNSNNTTSTSNTNSSTDSAVTASVSVNVTPTAATVTVSAYESASLKVPSVEKQPVSFLAPFWLQCREALSYCCAALYPAFLAVIVLAYVLHFTTQEKVFASFAVVFTILSGIVLGFFFVAVVPFVVLTRTVERYLQERHQPDSVFVHLLTRIFLLLLSLGALFLVQVLA